MNRPPMPTRNKAALWGCVFVPLALIGFAILSVALLLSNPKPDRFPEKGLFGVDKPNAEVVTNAGLELSFTGTKTPMYYGDYLVPEFHQLPFEEAVAKYGDLLLQRGWTVDGVDRDNCFATWRKGSRFLTLSDGRGFNPGRVPDPVLLFRQVSIMDEAISTSDRLRQVFKR